MGLAKTFRCLDELTVQASIHLYAHTQIGFSFIETLTTASAQSCMFAVCVQVVKGINVGDISASMAPALLQN